MKLGERDVSVYEIIHGYGARWYWDRRYVSESELEEQEPLLATLLAAIESALEKRVKIVRRHERIRLDIIKDLIKLDLLTCRPISAQRHTRPLAEVWQAVADEETVQDATSTMQTEHAQ